MDTSCLLSLLGQSEVPAVQCDNKIFILSGYSWDAHSFHETIQMYDLDTNAWELSKNKLPEPMTGVVARHVKLKQRMFDDTLVG